MIIKELSLTTSTQLVSLYTINVIRIGKRNICFVMAVSFKKLDSALNTSLFESTVMTHKLNSIYIQQIFARIHKEIFAYKG